LELDYFNYSGCLRTKIHPRDEACTVTVAYRRTYGFSAEKDIPILSVMTKLTNGINRFHKKLQKKIKKNMLLTARQKS
jgi:hypothetical protein